MTHDADLRMSEGSCTSCYISHLKYLTVSGIQIWANKTYDVGVSGLAIVIVTERCLLIGELRDDVQS